MEDEKQTIEPFEARDEAHGDERLLKLADHLERGKLGHKEFDFTELNYGNYDGRGCGTAGCALGECPIAFPSHWKFSEVFKSPRSIVEGAGHSFDSAKAFFALGRGEVEVNGLFCPNLQDAIDLPTLGDAATKEQVAANIRLFVDRRVKNRAKSITPA